MLSVRKLLQKYGCMVHYSSSLSCETLLCNKLKLFILVINQLDAKNLFYNKFISCLYMFREPCAHCQEVKTCRGMK